MSSTKHVKLFGLVDCDNFYVSCERVFQARLRGRPLIVLSNNDGCVVARSPEVKALGIGMGKPFYQVKDIVERENITVFSSNYTLYGDMSRRVMKTLRNLVPFVDIYSIDEAFINFETKFDKKYGLDIRQTILTHTGIPVTIGVGSTKTLAKIAASYAKKNKSEEGVADLTSHSDLDIVLSQILVQDIWGVGLKTAEWLYRRDINTALDLKNIDDVTMRKKAGVMGLRVVYELRGISCIENSSLDSPRKGITSSRSFGRYVTELDDLRESVATHASRAAEKLRSDGSVAGLLSVFITTNIYSKSRQYANTARVSVMPSSNATSDLIRLALIGVERIYKPGYQYIKAGITLNNITPVMQRQMDMFAPRDMVREERLYTAFDDINNNFGTNTVTHLACGIEKGWSMKRGYRSPRYTTSWQELPVARIE